MNRFIRLGRSACSGTLRTALLAGSIGLGALALAPAAFAQDAPPSEGPVAPPEAAPPQSSQGADIVVTGSRIARRDFTATSPIVTVDTNLIEKTSSVNLEANLNKLPQFAPALTQFTTGDLQSSANNTVGASTVSLRQLGSNRNLVLLDGRRGTPINGSGVIDVNTIPSAAIQRVEIITGGASSTYGADAVGGVVNFILKKNFQGVEVDGQAAVTQYGDGFEYRLSAITGANFDDGRGNVMLGLEHFERQKIKRIDREFYRDLLSSPTTGGSAILGLQMNSITWASNPALPNNNPSQAAIDALLVPQGAAPGTIPRTSSFFLNDDDTLFVNSSLPAIPGRPYTPLFYGYNGPIDGLFRKVTAAGTLAENNLGDVLSIPQDRWTLFTSAHYDVTDDISFFTQGYFAKTHTISLNLFSPATGGWATLIPHGDGLYTGNASLGIPSSLNADGTTNANYLPGGQYGLSCGPTGGCTNSQVFPVSPDLNTLLNSRPDPNQPWVLNQYLQQIGERRTINNNISFQLLAGFNGKVPGTDWTWEVFGSHGETIAKTDQYGFGSVARWRAVVSAPNYGQGFHATGNSGTPGNNFEGAVATCQTGVSPFNQGMPWSQDCINAVEAKLQNENRITQTQWQANLQGGLFDLPYGQLRFAAGAEYRRNSIAFKADSLATQGASFLEGVHGILPQGNTQGSTEVTEFYGELLVPLLSNLPFFKALNLELGYRISDYSSIGSVGTYKINGDWQVNDWLTFRGGYQKASRAPNLGELFTASTGIFGSTFEGDPCSTRNPSMPAFIGNYSANPTLNPNAAAVQNLCRQIMGPVAAAYYYDPANLNGQSSSANGSAFLNLVGNPNLRQEDAKTYTIGGVLRAPSRSPWLSRLSLSVDYYHVNLTNAISQQGQDGIYRRCFSQAFNPSMALNDFCGLITRDPASGAPALTSITFTNGGEVLTAGIDTQIDWALDFKDAGIGLPGQFRVNFLLNYLDSFKTTTDAGIIPLVDYAGTLGGGDVGTNAGAYRWKSFTTFTYSVSKATLSLQWRHLPSARAAITASQPTATNVGAPAYDIFDLSGTVTITGNATLRFGVDNLFNKAPPLTNYDPGAILPTLPGGSFNPGFYDVLGRRFYIGAKFKL